MAVNIRFTVLWDTAVYSLVDRCQYFGGNCRLLLRSQQKFMPKFLATDFQSFNGLLAVEASVTKDSIQGEVTLL
jgi:hypothetical protein